MDVREQVRAGLLACNQPMFDRQLFTWAFENPHADIEMIMKQELASAPHNVQQYWLGQCDCGEVPCPN